MESKPENVIEEKEVIQEDQPSESMVYSREEYAKPEFWNDRFK